MSISWFGLRDLSPVTTGRAPLPLGELIEEARWTVSTEEDEAEAGLGCRWCNVGCAKLDAILMLRMVMFVLQASRAHGLQSRSLAEPDPVTRILLRFGMQSQIARSSTVLQASISIYVCTFWAPDNRFL